MIRVLYLGAFSDPTNTECYIASALERAGCEVQRLEEKKSDCKSIVAAAQEFEPDVFLFAKARFKEADIEWPQAAAPIAAMLQLIRPHVGKIVGWQFDLLCKEFAVGRYQWAERVAKECDIFAMTDGYTAKDLANSMVLRQGVPDDVDQSCEWDLEPKGDVLFLGTPYRDRQELRVNLQRHFGDRFRHENNTRGAALTRLIRSYKICVGPHFPHFANYWSNRIYVVTGHGGLFACPTVPGMNNDGWKAGQNYLALPNDVPGIVSKLQEYLTKHDAGQLAVIRRIGWEHAIVNCSYYARVRQLLAMVAAEPSNGNEIEIPNGEPVVVDDWGYEAPEDPTELEGEEARPIDAVQDAPAVALEVNEASDSDQSRAA